ncbi:hypothetical protein M501DRAFT_999059 [Patellaria atrata CBS 101060]|uniref:Zn(2)-C6 fungal-type domain-containing protein n=1 Tax=Patellaria atrata CBS 101060 TaxID=1346257 RepID=A0A9P4VMU7_9PEZI|nr:hypothetical protein M501DRAFT_999059 [Patellaria atrata CBS 101060]
MPTPCSTCRRQSRTCRLDLSSGFCSKCVARGSKCDLMVTQKDWDKLNASRSELRRKLAEARVSRDNAHARMLEAFAREERLMQQLQLLDQKEGEMIRRELSSIEELEALERAAEGQRASSVAPSSSAVVSPSGWSGLDFSALEGLEFPGFGDETVQVSDRNSSNV